MSVNQYVAIFAVAAGLLTGLVLWLRRRSEMAVFIGTVGVTVMIIVLAQLLLHR